MPQINKTKQLSTDTYLNSKNERKKRKWLSQINNCVLNKAVIGRRAESRCVHSGKGVLGRVFMALIMSISSTFFGGGDI